MRARIKRARSSLLPCARARLALTLTTFFGAVADSLCSSSISVCEVHAPQTSAPHERQWCRRVMSVYTTRHWLQSWRASSAIHLMGGVTTCGAARCDPVRPPRLAACGLPPGAAAAHSAHCPFVRSTNRTTRTHAPERTHGSTRADAHVLRRACLGRRRRLRRVLLCALRRRRSELAQPRCVGARARKLGFARGVEPRAVARQRAREGQISAPSLLRTSAAGDVRLSGAAMIQRALVSRACGDVAKSRCRCGAVPGARHANQFWASERSPAP